MATRHISINVGGLWRTSVELKEEATWYDLKNEINKVIGISLFSQILTPSDNFDKKCELEEGDEVFCEWASNRNHPLHFAAAAGNIKAIQSWLASGADINMVNKDGMTSLMSACLNLKEECVVELLRLGANVQMEDDDGETVLHKIAHYRSFDAMRCDIDLERIERMAKILIKAGCDPTTRNKNGKTFIDKLKRRDCNELAKIKHNKKMKI